MSKGITPDYGLGRRKKVDSDDKKFPMSAVLPKKIAVRGTKWHYANGRWGNQQDLPHCVGFSWTHFLEDGPVTQKGIAPVVDPSGLYALAQRVDEWPGENYDGTSVRAGAKVLQSLGWIGEYRWAFNLDTVIDALLTFGPVVVGTNWYRDMFYPEKGFIKVGGRLAGGHAYILNGINVEEEKIRIKNSWGREWGNKGHVFISFADMERLIEEDGEAVIATENKR